MERGCAPPGCLIFSLAALRRAKKIPPWAVWGWYISIKLSTTAEMPGKGVKGGNEGGGYCLTNSRTEREPPGVSPCLRSRVWYSSKKKIIQGCGGVAPAWEVTTLGEGQKL